MIGGKLSNSYIEKSLRWYDNQHGLYTSDRTSLIPSFKNIECCSDIGLSPDQITVLAILYYDASSDPIRYVYDNIEALVPLLAYIENGIQ